MDYEDIDYTVEGPTAIITMNRSQRYNAFRAKTVEEMINAFRRAWADAGVQVVILTGAGEKAFCTGGDVKQRAETGDYGPPSESGMFEIGNLHKTIRDIPKPVIAAVNGLAIGGGHVLHVLCDLTIAADTARFGQSGPKVGSFDAGFGSAFRGPRRGGETGPRDLVPVPPIRRRDRRTVGPGELGRPGRRPARRSEEDRRRDRREVAHHPALPEAELQCGHRSSAGLSNLAMSALDLFTHHTEEGAEGGAGLRREAQARVQQVRRHLIGERGHRNR